jgi:tRNA dimethylallyltransferase
MHNADPLRIALIGPTASGKSALALALAEAFEGLILSLDSLALYREIDIASAKPSPEERARVPHYGIDLIDPDEPFDVTRFAELYREVSKRAAEAGRPLFIVGGSSFYLKILMEGLSPLPEIRDEIRREVDALLRNLPAAYETLRRHAPDSAAKITPKDRYRIEKFLLILLETGEDPVRYFAEHPPRPVIEGEVPLFELSPDRERLRERIRTRTDAMFRQGLLDEVAGLEARYGRAPQSMKAIGIAEVLDYFDGKIDRKELREKIVTNTARLAKRQTTFNRSQFANVIRGEKEEIKEKIERYLYGEKKSSRPSGTSPKISSR